MYTCWEDWGYLDSFYFVFISISTIGFGDFTPAHTKYFIVTSVYVFIGLSLVSMCINVLIELYIFSLNVAVHKMDIVKSRVKKGCVCGIRRQSIWRHYCTTVNSKNQKTADDINGIESTLWIWNKIEIRQFKILEVFSILTSTVRDNTYINNIHIVSQFLQLLLNKS